MKNIFFIIYKFFISLQITGSCNIQIAAKSFPGKGDDFSAGDKTWMKMTKPLLRKSVLFKFLKMN